MENKIEKLMKNIVLLNELSLAGGDVEGYLDEMVEDITSDNQLSVIFHKMVEEFAVK